VAISALTTQILRLVNNFIECATLIESSSSKPEKKHLKELVKENLIFTFKAIDSMALNLKKLENVFINFDRDEDLKNWINYTEQKLVDIQAIIKGCKTASEMLNFDDTISIVRLTMDLLLRSRDFKQTLLENYKMSFTYIDRLIEDYENKRPVVRNSSIISIISDRNGNFLGAPGPYPVYWITGSSDLTTEKFGVYANFKIMKCEDFGHQIKTDFNNNETIKFGDRIAFYFEYGGFLRHFMKSHLQTSWWEFQEKINRRGIFEIVHPSDKECTREIRIGERVAFLMTGAIKNNELWEHRYLSGRFNSRGLKLSSTMHTWTVHNSDGNLFT
jgi:hypothetical protein